MVDMTNPGQGAAGLVQLAPVAVDAGQRVDAAAVLTEHEARRRRRDRRQEGGVKPVTHHKRQLSVNRAQDLHGVVVAAAQQAPPTHLAMNN